MWDGLAVSVDGERVEVRGRREDEEEAWHENEDGVDEAVVEEERRSMRRAGFGVVQSGVRRFIEKRFVERAERGFHFQADRLKKRDEMIYFTLLQPVITKH